MEPPGGSPVSRRTRSRTAVTAEKRVVQPAEAPAVGVAASPSARAREASGEPSGSSGPKRAASKRPWEPMLSEDDYSCPICLNLLVDPVVGSCGHDFCELCFRRWTVDQRKRSCPSCRKALATDLPGICLRLAHTMEALFPERVRERQAEVAEERRALAAEKRAREEEARREAAARQAAGPALDFGGDLLMHAVLEQLLQEPIFRQAASRSAAEPQRNQQRWQQLQEVQEQEAPSAARVQRANWPPTQRQQEGRLVQRRYPVRAAAGAGPDASAAQRQVQDARGGAGAQRLPTDMDQGQAGGVGEALQTLRRARQQTQARQGHQARQAQQAQQAQQAPQAQQQHVVHRQHFHVQVIHFQSGLSAAGTPALDMPAMQHGLTAGNGPQPAAGSVAAAAALTRSAAHPAAAWPMGPPLDEMEFSMGWHDASEAHTRRRRQSRGRR